MKLASDMGHPAGRRVPGIILFSGYDSADAAEIAALGVEAYLPKPIRRTEMVAAAETALGWRSAVRVVAALAVGD